MAYRLKKGQAIPENIARIVEEEADSASEQLLTGKNREEAIHEARKSIKKIRGVLRLVAPQLGATYKEENARLRHLGRGLSELRDGKAMIEAFDSLFEKHRDERGKRDFGHVRRGLETRKREAEEAADVDAVTKRAVSGLHTLKKRIGDWPLSGIGYQALAPGLEASYRRGRKVLRKLGKNSPPEQYHEFRKRVKDHWYHMRLLESLWTGPIQARESSLKELETWLGDDHNLVVLCEKLAREPEKYGGSEEVNLFLELATREQRELRQNSISLGQRVYEQKPREFVHNLSKLWDAWKSEPDSMTAVEKEHRKAPRKAQPAARKAVSAA